MEIRVYLRMLLRSWWVIALTALVAVGGAFVASYFTTPIYRSSATYIVSPNPSYLLKADYNLIYSLDTLDKRTLITTYAEVLNSTRMFNETLQLLKLTPNDVVGYS